MTRPEWVPLFPDDLVASAVFDAFPPVDLVAMTLAELDRFAAWAHVVHSPEMVVVESADVASQVLPGGPC